MPRLQEITADDDPLDACTPATDEEAIRPQQFQAFKKSDYDSAHLNPGKSVLKVLWERVSAEIAQRSGHTVQAGVKGSVKKAWSPPTTPYEEIPMSPQQLHSADEKSTAEAAWERGRVSKAAWEHTSTDHKDVADMQAGLPAMDKGRNEPEQQLTGSDHETAPSLATREPEQMVWNRGRTAFDRKNVADVQDDNISNTASKEEGEIEAERDNLSLDKSNPEHQRQLEEDVMTIEKPQKHEPQYRIGLKTQDSTSDFAPRGEPEDQDSMEEKVTTYDAVPKEKPEEHVCLAVDPENLVKKPTPTFGSQENACRLPDYSEERTRFNEAEERNQYSFFMMEAQQTGLPGKEIQGEVKPRHMLHEDVPSSKTMDFLSSMSDRETKRGGSEEDVVLEAGEEEVPYLSYNPPEAAQKVEEVEAVPENAELQETTRDEKIEELRKELETLEGYDDDDDACCAFDEDSLTLRPSAVSPAADGCGYLMPDPVRARLDEEVLLYHMPRSPEAPRRFTDKVFFRFK